MTISTRIVLGISAAALSLSLALAPAAFAQDKMGKDDGMMKKDTMSKDGMMKKDTMSKDSMKKGDGNEEGRRDDQGRDEEVTVRPRSSRRGLAVNGEPVSFRVLWFRLSANQAGFY